MGIEGRYYRQKGWATSQAAALREHLNSSGQTEEAKSVVSDWPFIRS